MFGIKFFAIQTGGNVTDLISFYCLPSTIVNHPVHRQIKAAYSFYNVATTVPLSKLMHDALILAKNVRLLVLSSIHVQTPFEFLNRVISISHNYNQLVRNSDRENFFFVYYVSSKAIINPDDSDGEYINSIYKTHSTLNVHQTHKSKIQQFCFGICFSKKILSLIS